MTDLHETWYVASGLLPIPSLIPGFSSLSDETLNRGPMIIFQDKLLTKTYCDEAGDYAVSKDPLIFSPDLSDINWTVIN